MNNKAIVIVRLFSPKKMECDLEIPLDITAYELFIALNEAFGLGCSISVKEACYLCSESPIAFLTGDRLLSDYGIRDGTVINLLPKAANESDWYGNYLKDFDFTKVTFDFAVDLSSRGTTMVGNTVQCHLRDLESIGEEVVVNIVNSGNRFFLQADGNTVIGYNGKLIMLNQNPLAITNFDFIHILGNCYYFYNQQLYFDRRAHIQTNGISGSEKIESIGAMHYPEFIRNSRLKMKLNDEPITLLAPKEKPTRPKSNLLLKLTPALAMIVLTIIIRGVMGNSNLSFVLFSVCSMSIGAIVSTVTIINDKKDYEKQIVDRQIGYRKYIDKKKAEIEDMRREELQLLNRMYYRYDETVTFAQNFSGSLFDRTPVDEDFLEIRIGTGMIDAVRKIDYKPQEKYESDDDELVDLPVQVSEEYKKIKNAPILVQLKRANVVGVVGSDELLYEMMKIMYFDLCIRQHYDEVRTVLLVDGQNAEQYSWIKWFKHIRNHNFRNIVCDNQSKSIVFEYLYGELMQRSESRQKEHLPHIVVFVMNDFGIKEHPLSKYIDRASEYGVTFIFFENYRDYIPVGCSQLVLMDTDTTGRVIKNENTEIIDFRYAKIKDSDLYRISYKLAPVYCQDVSLEVSLTPSITLYKLLGIQSEREIDLTHRWMNADVTRSMAVPIGVRAGDELVYLDIHDGEKGHGPHGLVAGTTGSGKSELLMTYILSMAVQFSPLEVGFLIIDFKAGGMADHFRNLPHTLGIITNIDGKEIQRSLVSIEAEIERRQKLFAQAQNEVGSVVDNIDKYIQAWKAHKVSIPLPHLIIIVDEFAELKAQFSDFMETLKSAARIGRTLGIHLILATQRPNGQIDPQIDVNSKFRLCLKVQSVEDSRDMIKTPLASEIREAGRAYFMVQNSDVFDLVQTAYSGAASNQEAASNQKDFTIYAVDFAGRRMPVYQKKNTGMMSGGNILTQNEAIVMWINDYCKANRIPKLANICQPPLPDILGYQTGYREEDAGIYAKLGIFDDPAQQRQEEYIINAAIQHTLIIGTLQTGKTNILQLMIRNLSEKYTPDEVNFYIIDYSSMIMTNFNNLAHVGGVVVPNEEEKLSNLFKYLLDEIKERKQKLKNAGVSSFISYREAGKTDIPLIVLMIDNLSSLKELFLNDNPILLSVLREGLSVGISVVVANSTSKGLEYKYLSMFSCRIGLYHSNAEEYGTLFGGYKLSVSPVPGRCLVSVDRRTLECQLSLAFQGEKEYQRVQYIGEFISRINAFYPQKKAMLIPEIPEFLMEKEIRRQYASMYAAYQVILGFDYDTLLPRCLNLSGLNLILSGTPKSGKGNFIYYLISCIQANQAAAPAKIAIFDKATSKKFERASMHYDCIAHYELSSVNMGAICKEWKQELSERKKLVLEHHGDMSVLADKPLLMMICEDSSKDMLNAFDETLFDYSAYKFAWIASNVVNDEISPMKTPKLFQAKKAGADCLLFGAVQASKIFDSFIKISLTEKNERLNIEVNTGDAFFVESADPTKVYRMKTIIHQPNTV